MTLEAFIVVAVLSVLIGIAVTALEPDRRLKP